MPAKTLTGKPVAEAIAARDQALYAELRERGVTPSLAVLRVGEDPGSVSYARSLERSCERFGFGFRSLALPADTTAEAVAAAVEILNQDVEIHGIMLQEPLPEPLVAEPLRAAIDPAKDVDGVHHANAGLLFQGSEQALVPATALGGVALLDHYEVPLRGARVVVIGRSLLVGRPLALLLLHRHATVTVCHSRTVDLPAVAREADVLAVAIGRPHYVTPAFVKAGAVVLDFGVNFVAVEMVGDVAPEVAETAGALTPTPGGTGAVTTAMLRHNVLLAASRLS